MTTIPIELIKRLQAAGVTDEDMQAIIDAWCQPVTRIAPSSAALRQARYREKKKALDRNGDVTVTPETTKKGLPQTPSKETTKNLPSEDQKEPEVVSLFPDSEDIDLALDAYRQVAEQRGLPLVRKMSDMRRRKLKQRLRDAGSLEGWYEACRKLQQSKFLQEIRADLDFMLQEKSFIRLIEGKYDDKEAEVRGSGVFRSSSGAVF